VFENPSEANTFREQNCGNTVCDEFDFDYEYPFPISMIDSLYKLMMDAELKLGMLITQDTENNSNDDIIAQKQ